MKKKYYLICAIAALTVVLAIITWNCWLSTTRVAFINYQVVNLGEIYKANKNSSITIHEVTPDNLDQLDQYDMVFINGMGLRITEEQRERIQKIANNGLPVLTSAATNPANLIVSIDSTDAETLKSYLSNGGRQNYASLLNYVRKYIDNKIINIDEPKEILPRSSELLYHNDPKNPEEELGFNSVSEYEGFLKKNKLWRDDAPRVIVTGMMGEPTQLINKLEETGSMVYPARNMRTLIIQQQIDSIRPAAVINMAHGRMGDMVVNCLNRLNIPLFAPLNINRLVDEWEADKMGMSGGFLSQSVVTPEIDGAIRPYALFGHYADEEGLQHAFAIPERLETFVQTVNNYIQLQEKPNSQKKVAIYYYKGVGQNSLIASGMEVVPSLFNLLKRLQREGYTIDNLPSTAKELERMIQSGGAVFGSYAEGAKQQFLQNGNPELIKKEQYEGWIKESIHPQMYSDVLATDGEFPGNGIRTDGNELPLARLQFGNVVLLPQSAAGNGDNAFKIVHGTDAAPPHQYIASYLWVRHAFKADALIHFGTHGSLEFTPRKQVALSSKDWPDRLVGTMPHFYIYSIGNVGEGMIAKRRSYAGLQSYLTPPFMESSVRGIYRQLMEAIKTYNQQLEQNDEQKSHTRQDELLKKASISVKKFTVELGIHRELGMDSTLTVPYSQEEVARIETFSEELATEKITGQFYTMGIPYEPERISSSVIAMTTDPIAYSLQALDKLKNRADVDTEKHKSVFTLRYLIPAKAMVTRLLTNEALATDELICKTAKISIEELNKARQIERAQNEPKGMLAMMMAMEDDAAGKKTQQNHAPKQMKKGDKTSMGTSTKGQMKTMDKGKDPSKMLALAKMMGANEESLKKMQIGMQKNATDSSAAHRHNAPVNPHSMDKTLKSQVDHKPEYTKEELSLASAILEVERTIKNVVNYRSALQESPEKELASLINAMNGGYVNPSPGGDPIANPNTLPTGRNLFGINAEETPTESAWEKGKQLAINTIEMYKKRHNDSIPRKVSYTLWSGEFIETGGATIAQVLYMLGVEPIRDAFGRVTDIRLIPSEELGRPRIDVVVQTSGQLRDLAASRLFLISRAVEMAAASTEDKYDNQVTAGVVEAERVLIEKGLTPKEARDLSVYRVFGGVNGNYGTGIQGMVQNGDRWENEREIADVYLSNMGAFYGSEKNWETVRQFAFEAALTRTDAVIQPRQSNTWGALSLDHVYEFMGGMNLAVRNVTGKDPDAYLSDYRNRNNMRMQEVKEAIGVESRTTIFNPSFIKEKMKGEASAAHSFAEIVQNTYAWNVMKPKAIDPHMWDEIYNVYVKDKFKIGVKEYFEKQNPAALEEMTAVMMETARKGMWDASEQQLADIAKLHTDLIEKYNPSCSGFVCDNAKLQQFIATKTDGQSADQYQKSIAQIREKTSLSNKKAVVMKKEEMSGVSSERQTTTLNNAAVVVAVVVAVAIMTMVIRRRRKKMQE